jgi:hypothetical protein
VLLSKVHHAESPCGSVILGKFKNQVQTLIARFSVADIIQVVKKWKA